MPLGLFQTLYCMHHAVSDFATTPPVGLFIHAYGIILYIFFLFGQIRTLVAMATFSLLWLYLANSHVSQAFTGPLVLWFNINLDETILHACDQHGA